MARARNIKPGFFRNADLVELSFEARLLFIGLWTIADKAGRLEDRPKQIKMELFPADNLDCNELLNDLDKSKMIERYTVEGVAYIKVTNFSKHQNPHKDEKPSVIPDKHDASTVQAPCKVDATSEVVLLIPSSLIPDSLIQEPMSGKPDEPAKKTSKPKNNSAATSEVISYLNEKAGTNFQLVEANTKLVAARMNEGATLEAMKRVIDFKVGEWIADSKMREYLRPATLFNAEKFAQYTGQVAVVAQKPANAVCDLDAFMKAHS